MNRKKFSYTDHALLRMDDPNNLMVVTGLMTFDGPLDYESLVKTVERSLLPIRRFRQRVVPPKPPSMRPYWEDDLNFKLETHLERIELPPPADQTALLDLISQLISRELDYSRPLWQFYIIENYGEGSAFIARIHHSIADGIALMQVLLSLTDTSPDPSNSNQIQNAAQDGSKPPSGPIKTQKSSFLTSDNGTTMRLWEEGKKMLNDPSHIRTRARQIIDLTRTLGRLALLWSDPSTIYKGALGKAKRATLSEPIALKDVKFIGKTFTSTVNDVLLTAVAGALGRYIDFRGDEGARDVMIRGFIPVNLRPLKLDEQLGNKFGLVFHSMPIGIDDPIERLRMVKRNMDALKSSSEAIATFGVINMFGAVPSQLERLLVDFFDTKGTAIITNVPGPQTQLYLAGAPINTVMAWVPQSGKIALGISIISYNGKVWLGVATDKDLVPDPEVIIDLFHDEFQEMISRGQKTQAARQKYIQPMSSRLDEAIQALDDLLGQSRKD